MNFKLKNTLIWMTLFSVLILSAVGVTYQSTSSLVEKTIFEHLHSLTVETAKKIEIWLNQQMKILNATADSIDFRKIGNNPETLGPLKMAMKAGHFSDVYIGLPTGKIIDGADWSPPETYDTRIRPWYLRAIEAGQTSLWWFSGSAAATAPVVRKAQYLPASGASIHLLCAGQKGRTCL